MKSWQNTTLENIKSIAEFSAKAMRTTTTTFLANQNFVFKNAVKKRLRPLLPSDEVFENMLSRLSLDTDCLNPENLPLVDNDLTSGPNGALIKVRGFETQSIFKMPWFLFKVTNDVVILHTSYASIIKPRV